MNRRGFFGFLVGAAAAPVMAPLSSSVIVADEATRAEYFAQALGSGGRAPWMTVNEVRLREDHYRGRHQNSA